MNITVTNNATTGSITLTSATISGASDFELTGGSCTTLPCGVAGGSVELHLRGDVYAQHRGTETGTLSILVAEDPNGGPPGHLSGTGLR